MRPFFRHTGALTALLLLCATLALSGTACQAQEPDWQRIWARIDQATTEEGFQEVAQSMGLSWVKDNSERLGLAGGGVEFLLTPGTPFAERFGAAANALGVLLIAQELAHDLYLGRPMDQTLKHLGKNSSLFALALTGVPALKALSLGLEVFMRGGEALARMAFTGDEAIWWPIYQAWFERGPGRLEAAGWLALFQGGGDLAAFQKHMDAFFSDEGKLFVVSERGAFEQKGLRVPRVADPEDLAVRKLAEPFRIRYFHTVIQKRLAGWAEEEAKKQVQREVEKLKAELQALLRDSIVSVKVQDHSDGSPVSGAWVEVSWTEGKSPEQRSARSDGKGAAVVQGVPPWVDGTLKVEKAGYVLWQDSPVTGYLSTTAAPKERTVGLVPLDVKVRATVVDAGTGAPVAGATIAAKERLRGKGTGGTTGANGSVDLTFPKSAEYVFTVTAAGYAPLDDARTLQAGPGGPVDLVFRLTAEGGVTVDVRAKDAKTGQPLGGVAVSASVGTERATATTGDDGTAKLVLPKATGRTAAVTCTREGYANASVSGPVDKGQARVAVALEPAGGTVRVIIREGKQGTGVPGVTATVTPGRVSGVTGPDGIVDLAVPLAPTVSVTCTKGRLPPLRGTVEMVDGKAQMTFLVNVEMIPLKVRVGDKVTQKPLAGVKVKAVVNGAEFVGATGKDGNLTLEIPEGETVKVYLYKQGYKLVEITKKIEGKQVPVGGTLTPEGVATLLMTLKDRATGKALAGAQVTVGQQALTTDRVGQAGFQVMPGEQLQISASLAGYQPRSDAGVAPQAGETKKVGWYLDPLAATRPAPVAAPPKPAAGGGGNTPFCGVYHGRFRYDPGVDGRESDYRSQPQFVKGVDTQSEFVVEIIRMVAPDPKASTNYPWDGLYDVRVRIRGGYPNSWAKQAIPFSGDAELQCRIGGSGVNDQEIQFGLNQKKLQSFTWNGEAGHADFNFYKEPGQPAQANIWYGSSKTAGQLHAVFDR